MALAEGKRVLVGTVFHGERERSDMGEKDRRRERERKKKAGKERGEGGGGKKKRTNGMDG
jgi:hypothetical protein